MLELRSDKVEKRLLSFYFRKPYFARLIDLDENKFFTRAKYRTLARLAKSYIKKYQQPPTKKVLYEYTKDTERHSNVDEIGSAMSLMATLPKPRKDEFEYLLDRGKDLLLTRNLYDVADHIKNALESDGELKKTHRKVLTSLLRADETRTANRMGFLHETAQERWNTFVRQDHKDDIIRFGMDPLDEALGGMRKTFTTLIYSKTGGGKTRTAVNVAINAARQGKNVIYFSLEMATELIGAVFDSRLAWLDSSKIIFSKLSQQEKRKYRIMLKKQVQKKLGVYVVDIPSNATTSDLYEAVETYRAVTGLEPDLAILDYANLLEPLRSYAGRSEKYDVLFKELHEFARAQRVALLTATQEKRQSNDNKKDKDPYEPDIENIGLSNYMAVHCETVLRLVQTEEDKLQNSLWIVVDKSRYSAVGTKISLIALWSHSYVGDRFVGNIPGVRVVKRRKKSKKKKE